MESVRSTINSRSSRAALCWKLSWTSSKKQQPKERIKIMTHFFQTSSELIKICWYLITATRIAWQGNSTGESEELNTNPLNNNKKKTNHSLDLRGWRSVDKTPYIELNTPNYDILCISEDHLRGWNEQSARKFGNEWRLCLSPREERFADEVLLNTVKGHGVVFKLLDR